MKEIDLKYRIVFSGYATWEEAKKDITGNKIKLSGFCYIEGYNPDGVAT